LVPASGSAYGQGALQMSRIDRTVDGWLGKIVDMPDTIACIAELIVHRPAEATLALFTAEGERAWAPG
jgi:hypothetical protein